MGEMDIYDCSKRKIVCDRNKDTKFFSCDCNSPLLEVGKTYTVENVYVHGWHTEVELEEFPSYILFNSACFREQNEVLHDEKHN